MALNYLGIDPNTTNEDDLKKAEDVLTKIRPYVKKFHSSEYINALANGDICMALGWSGDILQAANRATEAKNGQVIKYHIPKEGTQMWFDMMAIPADAKNVEEARIFLNYLNKPEVMAKATNFVQYANGNLASQKFINEDILKNPAVYPDPETLKKLYVKTTWDNKTQRVCNPNVDTDHHRSIGKARQRVLWRGFSDLAPRRLTAHEQDPRNFDHACCDRPRSPSESSQRPTRRAAHGGTAIEFRTLEGSGERAIRAL